VNAVRSTNTATAIEAILLRTITRLTEDEATEIMRADEKR